MSGSGCPSALRCRRTPYVPDRYRHDRWAEKYKQTKPPTDPEDLIPDKGEYVPGDLELLVIPRLPGLQNPVAADAPTGVDEPTIISKYESREVARTASPLALTAGGLTSAAVLTLGGPTIVA